MINYKLKPSICIAVPYFCKNICPQDTPCGQRRFLNKYGFNYLDNIRQTKPDSVTADNGGGVLIDDVRQTSFRRDKTADSNLEETLQPKVFKY